MFAFDLSSHCRSSRSSSPSRGRWCWCRGREVAVRGLAVSWRRGARGAWWNWSTPEPTWHTESSAPAAKPSQSCASAHSRATSCSVSDGHFAIPFYMECTPSMMFLLVCIWKEHWNVNYVATGFDGLLSVPNESLFVLLMFLCLPLLPPL